MSDRKVYIDALSGAIHDEDVSFLDETFKALATDQQKEAERNQQSLQYALSEEQRQFVAEALGLLAASIYAEQISRNFIISVAELFAPYLRLPQFLRAISEVMGANHQSHVSFADPTSDLWLRQIFVNTHVDEIREEVARLAPDDFYRLILQVSRSWPNQIRGECYSAFTEYLLHRDLIPSPIVLLEMAANIKSPTPSWLMTFSAKRGGRSKNPPHYRGKK